MDERSPDQEVTFWKDKVVELETRLASLESDFQSLGVRNENYR